MSKVTKIHPEGATLTRADGSAVNVGDDVSDGEALTITIASPAEGGAIVVGGSFNGTVRERVGYGIPIADLTNDRIRGIVRGDAPALAVGDTANPSRATPPVGRAARVPPVLKVE